LAIGAVVHPYPPPGRDITYRRFRTAADFGAGTLLGTALRADGVVLTAPTDTLVYTDPHTGRTGTYDLASWTSPAVSPGFAATEVIPSWTADTPAGSWIQIELRGTTEAGEPTRWYVLARWASDDTGIRRTTVPAQRTADGTVNADTFTAAAGRLLLSWQLRVTLLRPAGATATPTLRSIGAAVSRLPGRGPLRHPLGPTPAPSPPARPALTDPALPALDPPALNGPATPRLNGPVPMAKARPVAEAGPVADAGPVVPAAPPLTPPAAAPVPGRSRTARGVILDVPRFSQETHTGHYPQWDGGGEAWCSSTSTSMLLAFWGTGPSADDYSWVDPDDPRPWVDHAARQCFDYGYQGAGNWPFNTAYAGRYGVEAFVTRLRSLAEAERFIAAGVPLIVSASYRRGQIPGLDYDTRGHLMVLAGFTESGDPVLNDPFSPTDDTVRKPVDRARFEAVWLSTSGGLVYVIHPASVPLPPAPAQANW
jgi:hypothetical protein